jgi:hypothetical protein
MTHYSGLDISLQDPKEIMESIQITCVLILSIILEYPNLCTDQFETSTSPHGHTGIPREFDFKSSPGSREFDVLSLPCGGAFDIRVGHLIRVGNLNRKSGNFARFRVLRACRL